jgi:hypothetical protein
MAVELKAQSRDFLELLADQRPQLELGTASCVLAN